jgi:hypothetical protein
MRIKPWVLTGAASLVAISAIALVVASADPADAPRRLTMLFWAALGLGLWAASVTMLLWCRMNLPQAVWIGLLWAAAALGLLILVRAGYRDRRLLGGIILATLVISGWAWFRLRKQ